MSIKNGLSIGAIMLWCALPIFGAPSAELSPATMELLYKVSNSDASVFKLAATSPVLNDKGLVFVDFRIAESAITETVLYNTRNGHIIKGQYYDNDGKDIIGNHFYLVNPSLFDVSINQAEMLKNDKIKRALVFAREHPLLTRRLSGVKEDGLDLYMFVDMQCSGCSMVMDGHIKQMLRQVSSITLIPNPVFDIKLRNKLSYLRSLWFLISSKNEVANNELISLYGQAERKSEKDVKNYLDSLNEKDTYVLELVRSLNLLVNAKGKYMLSNPPLLCRATGETVSFSELDR